jgi:hypothetical protein
MNRCITCLVLLLAVLASRVAAEPGSALWPCPVFVPDSPYTDYPTGLEVEGDRVYLATNGTIAAFDVSDPAAPEFLGVSLTSGTTQRLTVSGGHAFLVGYHRGLNIHDLSNPAKGLPRVGGYELEGSASLLGVGVSGNRVFVSGHGTGLVVLDASSPRQPQVEGSAEHDLGSTDYFAGEHISVVDGKIYIAGHDDDWGGFTIYQDVPGGDPEFLGDFSMYDLPNLGTLDRVAVKDNVAYLSSGGAGFLLFDVSDPTAPKQLTDPDGESTVLDFSVADFEMNGNLIAAASGRRFGIIDVSDATKPVLRGELDLNDLDLGYGMKVAASGSTAYLAGHQRLAVIDFSDPDYPTITGSIAISGHRAQDVKLVGDLAYVVGDSGLGVFDLTDPAVPVEIGRNGFSDYLSLVVDGNRVAARSSNIPAIHFYDLGPEGRTPVLKDTIQENPTRDYDLEGDRFYVKRPNQGIFTYDVSDLSRVYQIGHWHDPDLYVNFFKVDGTTVFAGSWRGGFVILDASDPNQFSLLGALGGQQVTRFVIDGTLVYATRWAPDSKTELLVIDISNLSNPQVLGSVEFELNTGHINDLSVGNGFVFAALKFDDTNAYIFDVSDPANPVIVRTGLAEGAGQIDHLEARGDYLYLARGYLGLHVLETSLEVPKLAFTPTLKTPRPVSLVWDAPQGVLFPIEGSRNLQDWTPLGRFTGDSLDEAIGAMFDPDPDLPAFFRATER